jgi:hypothetical protein
VHGDAGQEAAHGARLAQVSDAPEKPEEHLLQQVLVLLPGPHEPPHRPIHGRREPVPGRELGARIPTTDGVDQRDIRGVRLALDDAERFHAHRSPRIVRAGRLIRSENRD